MKRWLKAELHAHTAEDPREGTKIVSYSAIQLVDAAAQKGFEVLSITNHDQILLDAELERYSRCRGILLIPGVEATLKGKHVLLYNFVRYEPTWRDFEIVRRHKGSQQLVIAPPPHPFFPLPTALRQQLFRHLSMFDALEYSQFYMQKINFNRRAEAVAKKHGLTMVGNSDVHRLSQLGCTYSRIYSEKTVEGVLNAIRDGDVQVVTKPVSALFVSRWFAQDAFHRRGFALRGLWSSYL